MKPTLFFWLLVLSTCVNCAPRKSFDSKTEKLNKPSISHYHEDPMDDKTMIEKHRGLLAWLGGFGQSISISEPKIPISQTKTSSDVKSASNQESLSESIFELPGSPNKILKPESNYPSQDLPRNDSKPINNVDIKAKRTTLESSNLPDSPQRVLKSETKAPSSQNTPPNDAIAMNNIDVKAKRTTKETSQLHNNANKLISKPLYGENNINVRPPKVVNGYRARQFLHRYNTGIYQQSRNRASMGSGSRRNMYMKALYGKHVNKIQRRPAVFKKQSNPNMFKNNKDGKSSPENNVNQKLQGYSNQRYFVPKENHYQGMQLKNGHGNPKLPTLVVNKLPRAILYPGGRCTSPHKSNETEASIGLCRHVSTPCHANEEATAICGRYYRCCAHVNATVSTSSDNNVQNPQKTTSKAVLPTAVVYPRGKCMLTKELPDYHKIGNCRPSPLKCNSNEDAPEICNSYFKCCVASKKSDNPSTINENYRKNFNQTLPFATMFPRGMCRISRDDRIRIGSCVPENLRCTLPNRAMPGTMNSILEPVARCPRRFNFQPEMICCAPKVKINNSDSNSNTENSTKLKDENLLKLLN